MKNPLLIEPANFRLNLLPLRLGVRAIQTIARTLTISLFCLGGTPILLGQAPSISSIAPAQGPISGGTVVTVTGTNFQGATLILDKVSISPATLSATQATFTTPVHDNGIAYLEISTPAGNAYAEFLFVPPPLSSLPPGYITTVAGIGQFVGFHRLATQSSISTNGTGFAFDTKGNLYLAEPGFNWVSVVRSNGIREPFAGTDGGYGGSSDVGNGGPALQAHITYPRGVTTDSSGKVYITDQGNRLWSVDTNTGIATTIAGNGTAGYSGDGGPAINAVVGDVTHIAGDGKGTLIFITYNNATGGVGIRRITPDGIITTVAGNDTQGFSGDGGPATQAQFNFGSNDGGAIALDPSGNLYVADTGNKRVRRVDGKSGIITTVTALSPFGYPLFNLFAVAVDALGNIYYAYNPGNTPWIVEIDPTGMVLAKYGGNAGSSADGTPITNVALGGYIQNLGIDPNGNIVYCDGYPAQVRRLNLKTGLLETLAGVGIHPIGEIGPATAAVLGDTNGDLAFLPTGELLLCDSINNLVRKIGKNGDISTVAGYGVSPAPAYPLPALDAHIYPVAVKIDTAGQVFLADAGNIFRIDLEGNLSPFAGLPAQFGYAGDGGPAMEAVLDDPWDMAFDSAGDLFIADSNNNRIRRVDVNTGTITTVAGSGPVNGPEHYKQDGAGSDTGDGGPATQATLDTPYGVAVDSHSNLFISSGNYPGLIRRVDPQGIITTFATVQGDLSKLTFDGAGNLYAMVGQQRLMRFDPSGNATVLAGGGVQGFSGDGGPASQAILAGGLQASGIAIDTEGNIFFIDGQNLRVRAIRNGASPTPNAASIVPSRLINLSCRAQVGAGASQLIVGFAVSTASIPASEPLLIRASGPALERFGVGGVLADPTLTLNSSGGIIASNNGWSGNSQVALTAAAVGAFAWTSTTSHDSAIIDSLPYGAYSAQITGSGADTGVALAEVYDATPMGTFTAASPRLINLSARVMVGTGNNVLIAGFVIAGTTSKAILIRASGPALAAFGVPGILPDPQLSLYRSNSDGSNTLLQRNSGWGGNSYVAAAAASAGAFSWGTASTPDSAILVALPPGAYSAEVTGASGDTGIALVEIYEAQ